MKCPGVSNALCGSADCEANGCRAQRTHDQHHAIVSNTPRVFRFVAGPTECRTCCHYQPGSPTAAAGTCRIKAPIVLPESGGAAVWPRVAQYEWCGDHARRSVPVEG